MEMMKIRIEKGVIKHTIEFWREYAGVEYSEEDAKEVICNLSEFFRILSAWDEKAREEQDEADES